ncbi:hypothetical protein [Acetanaerobacterium elongatum]|uniref:Uncharacterized protein n=1 Tax=Acetanaerobacterium elongatum TaxID=258515 RepID=A0A1H0A9U1_9FIRM|nr:hypothetical protein [Acetanaerobacterium elongatum]SDN30041.1 hypothetical protein SAMN05192585_11566 [Acetanaerobacterium elongatum]
MKKVYVDVTASFTRDGVIIPQAIRWEDDHIFYIDRVLDIRRAAAQKTGGAGIRYTCRIAGKEAYLFLEQNRWFVESNR